jgi:rhodanese-related sulfurtransferase
MQRIDVTELKRRLDAGYSGTLLDVRERWEYEICQIPGSVNVPMSQILNRLEELDKDAVTVVICHHGARSYQVAAYLENNGFSDITNLDGGISAWAEQIDNTMSTY